MLFALTETELKKHIPDENCNLSKMWEALEVFWKEVTVYAPDSAVNIPLIGGCISGIQLNLT